MTRGGSDPDFLAMGRIKTNFSQGRDDPGSEFASPGDNYSVFADNAKAASKWLSWQQVSTPDVIPLAP